MTRSGASLERVAALLVCVSIASLGQAQEPSSTKSSNEERARALFDEARALADANRWQEACPKFEKAYQLVHTGGTTIQLARCYEKIGRLNRAIQLYDIIVARADGENPERVEVARARAEELRRALKENKAPPPLPEPQAERSSLPPKLPAIISFSVSGAALTLGAIMGGLALSEMSDVKDQCNVTVCPTALEEDRDAAVAKGWVANIALPVGGAAAVLGVVLYFVLDDHQDEMARWSITPSGVVFRY